AAAAEGNHRAASEAEGLSLSVEDFEFAFDAKRAVVRCNDLCGCHDSSAMELRCAGSKNFRAAGKACSVLRDRGIHFVRPGEDPAFQVPNLAETGAAQELDGFRGTLSAAALRDNLAGAIELA